MKPFKVWAPVLLTVVFFIVGCSQGASPIDTDVREATEPVVADAYNAHSLLGLYTFICNPTKGTIEVKPLRDAEMHLNALKFLEPPLLVNLTLEGPPVFTGKVVDVDIGLRNPYLALKQYTGFDVCGIVFTHGSVTGFNDPELIIAGEGDTQLLNADGYSRWWNPKEFPHGETMFNYKDGLLGNPADSADFNCTINGYKYFADGLDKDDPLTSLDLSNRGVFGAGEKNIRHYTINFSAGLIFNYAIDACWKWPQGGPPYTVPDDFAPGANRPEAYNITITELENTLWLDHSSSNSGGYLNLQVDVWDHFNAELNLVSAESLAGLPFTTALTPVGGGEGYSTYELDFTGDTLTQNGEAELFITVTSEKSGYGEILPGKPVCAYFMHTFNISPDNPCNPDLDPPDTFIVSGCEDKPACTTKIELVVSGSDPYGCTSPDDLTYEWRKAKAGYGFSEWYPDMGPTITVKELEAGDWTVEVRAVDLAGNKDPEPAICTFNVSADQPPYGWASTWGGDSPYTDYGWGVVVDENGNTFVTGAFSDLVDFEPGPGVEEHKSIGLADAYLCKFDVCGNLIWVRHWGGPEEPPDPQTGAFGFSVAVDGSGDVYVLGFYADTVDFDPGSDVDEHTSNGFYDIFLSKFDPIGNFKWTRVWGGVEAEIGGKITVDASDNIYITGGFRDTVDFDPGPGTDVHEGGANQDAFLSKFDSSGAFQWALNWGGVDDIGGVQGSDVTTDETGNVYVVGWFGELGSVDFDPGPGTDEHTSSGHYDAYLSKFDSSGNYQWGLTWGGVEGDYGRGVATDGDDWIYVTGRFRGTTDFDPGPDIDEHTSEAGENGSNAFLSKLDSNGGFQWAKTWGGPERGEGEAVAVDGMGDVYVAGFFEETADLDPGDGVDERTSNGRADASLSKFNPDGDFLWARVWGAEEWDQCNDLAIDKYDGTYIAGMFWYTVDFDPGPGVDEHTSAAYFDGFVLHLMPDGYW